METKNIKSFAKQARLLLLDGVLQRLKYWGFNEDGSNDQDMQTMQGGYVFRGQVFTDASVPTKWKKLKKRLNDKQAVQDVIEEAAYTWFNRLMAIKILEENQYIDPCLQFTSEMRTPLLVQNAKRGQSLLTKQADKDLLLEYLQEDKEEQAFGLLVSELCDSNKLLHDVFGKIDDYTEILLPQNLLQKDGLLELINSDTINDGAYREVELIGWLYQFYISDKKDEVFAGFKKNKKARAEDIPAATQIFTPKWIVKYMVENTVGKIYLDYEPNSSIKADLKYLVENDSDTNSEAIISDITELTLIDPACGSGHILVTGFELLFKMYREEGYTAKQAVESILQHNIYGLDIDDRAMQLARFAVLLKAAQFDASILEKGIMPKIYAFSEDTLADSFKEEYYSKEQSDWYELRGMKVKAPISMAWTEIEINEKTKKEKEIKKSMTVPKGAVLNNALLDTLQEHCNEAILVDYSADLELFWGANKKEFAYSEFFYAIMLLQQGKNLGSAIKLRLSSEALNHIEQQYKNWNEKANKLQLNAFDKLLWDNLKPHLAALFLLTQRYTSVVANPPYMGQKGMNTDLKGYVNKLYPKTKSDLFAIFMEVCLNLCNPRGLMGMINQHSWMFLSSYEKYREELLSKYSIVNMLHLGARTFEELSGEVVQSTAFVIKNENENKKGTYFRLVEYKNNAEKERQFLIGNNCHTNISQNNFKQIPSNPIAYWVSTQVTKLFESDKIGDSSFSSPGVRTGRDSIFIRNWFEINVKKFTSKATEYDDIKAESFKWYPLTRGGEFRKWYGNFESVINLQNEAKEIKIQCHDHRLRDADYYFKEGVTWTMISSYKSSFRYVPVGVLYGNGGPVVFSENNFVLLAFLNSIVSDVVINLINPTLNITKSDIEKLPFPIETDKITSTSKECIAISEKEYSNYETSWNYVKSPLINEGTTLKNAYLTWQEYVTCDFFRLHANEEKLNQIFIDEYGLQNELAPEVPLKDITLLQYELDKKALETLDPIFRENGKDNIELPVNKAEILSQFISYAVGVFLGRYRLDKPGLNIAHPNPTDDELKSYTYNNYKIAIDDDGILPIMGEDCAFPDDALVRTKDLLFAIWGEDTLTENINFLHDALGMDLHKWLTEKFWGYHTSMYKKKPIYWLFSSNVSKPQNAAFKVLVYMHRMDKYTVQKIQRNYLHPHQEFIKREIEKLAENEESLSKLEMKRLEQLRNWELECRDYNEVLKELANQQIEFDLDDGVSVNYEKFDGAVANI
jgi:hypothetical protein